MATLPSVRSLTLDLPPSSLVFCPTQPQYFVVATYFLHPTNEQTDGSANGADAHDDDSGSAVEQSQQRSGSLILFRLERDTITHVVTKKTDFAILDAQWTPHPDRLGDLLAVATSTGMLAFYRLEITGDGADLVFSSSKAVADPSILVLSLAWHPWRVDVIGFTLSNGTVSLCASTEGDLWSENAVVYPTDIHHHDLEAWTLAFSGANSSNVLSGGDDAVFQCSRFNDLQEREFEWRDRKLHEAGVTAILPLTSDLAVTGSYDDHIRLIAYAAGTRRQVLAEKNLGGGVWRLRIIPNTSGGPDVAAGNMMPDAKSTVILASCMHAGARVVRLRKGSDGAWKFDVIAKFEEHKSMNYGSDVQPGRTNATTSIISTSFYDKLLCLWRVDLGRTEDGD